MDNSMTNKTQTAKIGSGILADNSVTLDNGKVIAQGLITTFWAWGFPCSRTCVAFTTIFDFPIGTMTLLVSLANKEGETLRALSTIDIKSDSNNGAMTAVTPLRIEFTEPGYFSIVCTLKGQPNGVTLPFLVKQREWPDFSEAEKQFAIKNESVIHKMRANVQCKKCSYSFIFEESIVDEATPGGVTRFPESGQLKCGDCGHVLQLRDIQGQLRASLKAVLAIAMKGQQ
jgi:hypothetical protein